MLPGREENGAQTPARKLGEKAPAAPALPSALFLMGHSAPRDSERDKNHFTSRPIPRILPR